MTDPKTSSSGASHQLPNDPARIQAVEEALLADARRHGHGASASFALRLALDEAIHNAFDHGRPIDDEAPDQPISVSWTVTPELVTIVVADHGPGFNPDAVADPTTDENLQRPGGRGLLLMRAYMTSVVFNEQGNSVTMRYVCPARSGSSSSN